VGTDGKLYQIKTTNLVTGDTYPTAAAVDTAGKFLYVTFQYQNGFSPTTAGPGGVDIFPINSDGSLGTPTHVVATVGVNPVGVAVTVPITSYGNSVFVYVLDRETAKTPQLQVYQQNTTTGALTYKSTINAGVTPSAVIAEPTGRYVYVSDRSSNQIIGYQINNANGDLSALPSSPYTTGLYPVAMTIDPRGKFLYTANYNSNTVSGYTINHADGSLGGIATSTFTTATGPTCVVVDPSVGIYLYTSNYLDNSLSGARLTTEDGTLKAVANTPFPTSVQPNCVVAVANGSHAQSIVNPN
jgi:6-phosphogluconolactonase (cycloisomerase 2 family)